MIKLFLSIKSLILISILTISTINADAQLECRSILGGHLTPIKKDSPLLWAIEGTIAPGVIDDASIYGFMVLGALDYTFLKKHHLYIEGGYKNWNYPELTIAQHESKGKNKDKNKHWGIRQVYYNFNGKTSDLKIGLHEMKLGDYLLLDERVLGISYNKEFGAFKFQSRLGTVTESFARMGRFCINRHLYNVIKNDYTEKIGDNLGETNLIGFTVNWNPSFVKKTEGTDIDEFSEFSDFSEFDEDKRKLISNIGIVFYEEFGSIIPDSKYYFGSLIDFSLPLNLYFQTGVVYQNMVKNNSLIYIGKLGRMFTWKSGANTELAATYVGKHDFDDNALFQPIFSNLFLGEIMRLDATDFPLWDASIKHNFTGKLKFNIELKAVGQIEGNKTSEIDFVAGIKLFKHSKITTIFSWVETNALVDDLYMARLELRVAF